MTLSYHHAADVLCFAAAQEVPVALIAAEAVTGGAMRAPGALMCVTDTGQTAGYMSNGCVDADIVFQAQAAIKEATPRRLRYGAGSPFKDIVLPCGGQIDLRVMPNMPRGMIKQCAADLAARRTAKIEFEIGGDVFSHTYAPKLCIRIAGRGEAVTALAGQALSTDFDVVVQSPDRGLSAMTGLSRFDHLTDPSCPPGTKDDPWTAIVVMFHDHGWEPQILAQALAGGGFYVGAMGSARTHAKRKSTLKSMGVSPSCIDRIHAPIGLIPSMRDGNFLAVSILADIVLAAQTSGQL